MKFKILFLLVFSSFVFGSDQLCAMEEMGGSGKELSAVNYFEYLPDELLREIFIHLDFRDLLGCAMLVNTKWKKIVVVFPFNIDLSRAIGDKENLKKLPATLSKLTSLKVLDLSGHHMLNDRTRTESCSINILNGLPKGIKKLSLMFCYLDMVPEYMKELKELHELDLGSNQYLNTIENIPNSVAILNLSRCGFGDIPKSLLRLDKLRILDLSWNKTNADKQPLVLNEANIKFIPTSLDKLNIVGCVIDMKVLEKLRRRLPHKANIICGSIINS